MRSLQALSSLCSRLSNVAVAGTSPIISEACSTALQICSLAERQIFTSAASARFRPTPSLPLYRGFWYAGKHQQAQKACVGDQTGKLLMHAAVPGEEAPSLPEAQPDLVHKVACQHPLTVMIVMCNMPATPSLHCVQFMGPEIMCSFERRRERLREAVRAYERFPGDTGSSEVQGGAAVVTSEPSGRGADADKTTAVAVAILTEKILHMAEHMKEHRKDFSSRE